MKNLEFENLDENLFEPMSPKEMENTSGGGWTRYLECNQYGCYVNLDATA